MIKICRAVFYAFYLFYADSGLTLLLKTTQTPGLKKKNHIIVSVATSWQGRRKLK